MIDEIYYDILGNKTDKPSQLKNNGIAKSNLYNGYYISTVHLDVDHNFTGIGPPLIYETMVFSPEPDRVAEDEWRTSTLEDALEMHKKMVLKYIVKGKK